MSEGSTSSEASLEETPTWAVSTICAVLITISVLIEHGLHLIAKFLQRRKRKYLNQAFQNIRAELMLLGFLSLLLTVARQPISKICIPKSMSDSFRPCENTTLPASFLEESTCQRQGKISLISSTGINELQFLIFILAVFHVLSCILTMGLGIAKMNRWESWEEETRTLDYQFSNDPRRFKLAKQTSFAKRHLRFWSGHPLLLWPASFIRQFTGSVFKTDYFALRHGFIIAHFSEGSKFDFRKFLRRALDEDFSKVVGMNLWIWMFSVLFIFLNAHKFHNYAWLPFIPLVMALIVGMKLQFIITNMCLESRDESVVVRGTLVVKPHDNLFWFGRPGLILHLIQFILFQNAFQLAFFTWTWYKFGLRSCFHRKTQDIIIRIATGFLVQLLIGYVTLPLYALVTQMGSSMSKVVFTERVADRLKTWHTVAKRQVAEKKSNFSDPTPEISPSHTVDTSFSEGIDLEFPSPSTEADHYAVDEITEDPPPSRSNAKGSYDGEISFGWRK
ncbi:MLO-like protein 12 [Aristolochia californica]|uniref:MLO-like protein 12 n=1 Tax=Aristolochia californica TaxID=171875 RepID=UPI0035DB30C1